MVAISYIRKMACRLSSPADGFSLVGILVALGLMGLIGSIVAQQMTYANKNQVELERKMDFQALNRFMLMSVHCELTASSAPFPCPNNTWVELKTAAQNGRTIVAKFNPATPDAVTKIGDYSVRAKCGTGNKLIIEAKRTRDSRAVYQDIYPDVPFGCVMP